MGEKRCSKCGMTYPTTNFYPAKRHSDGLHSWCKPCCVTASTAHHRANPPEYTEQRREYMRQYYLKNRERQNAYHREWARAHKDLRDASQQKKRAKRRGADVRDLTRAQWDAIKATYAYRCAYCGIKPERLTVDHVVALVNGGNHTATNVIPSCHPCNSRKNNRPAPTHQPLLLLI